MPEDCVILDLPEGLRLNLLGLIVQVDRILITADRAGLLGGLLASLTCGGVESADRLEALARRSARKSNPRRSSPPGWPGADRRRAGQRPRHADAGRQERLQDG